MNTNYEQAVKLWDETTETLNKLSYIAAGTISLSMTFLGYVLGIGAPARNILQSAGIFGLSLVYLLFLSWVLLFLSIFFGIVIRLSNARYLWNSHFHLWFKDLADKAVGESKDNLESVAKEAAGGRDKYWKLSKCIQYGTIAFFMLGMLSLIIFAIIATNRIVMI